jgi:hypothetical protein
VWKTYLLAQPEMSKMWGSEQDFGFERKVIIFYIYKDLVRVKYDKFLVSCDVGFKIVHQHQKRIYLSPTN